MRKPKSYPVKHWILETMTPYIEAAKCRTLDQIFGELDQTIKEYVEAKTQ